MRGKWILFFTLIGIISGCMEKDLAFTVQYDYDHGLKAGDPILYQDKVIGEVKSVHVAKDKHHLVKVRVDAAFSEAATHHTRFVVINHPGRAGGKAMELAKIAGSDVSDPEKPVSDGETVSGEPLVSNFFTQILDGIGKGLENLASELDKNTTEKSFENFSEQLAILLKELEETGKTASKNIDKELIPLLKQSLEQLRQKLAEVEEETREKLEKSGKQLEKEIDRGYQSFKDQFETFMDELKALPDSRAMKEMEKRLKTLVDEMNRAGEAVRKKFQEEVLPNIEKQLEELQKQFEKLRRKKEMKPIETTFKQIQQI